MRSTLVAAGYLLAITIWIYGFANTSDEPWEWLVWALLAVQPIMGFLVARWWAVLLPLVVVAISVPAGYPPITPENAEPFPIWFSLAVGAVVAIPLVTAGVVAGTIYLRRRRSRFST